MGMKIQTTNAGRTAQRKKGERYLYAQRPALVVRTGLGSLMRPPARCSIAFVAKTDRVFS
jgi:hypothetical protein